jgi:hypothetical protein
MALTQVERERLTVLQALKKPTSAELKELNDLVAKEPR